MKPFARLTQAERVAALDPYIGSVVRVRYRLGGSNAYDRDAVGRLVGATFPQTNNNSTGDLVLVPTEPGRCWVIRTHAGERIEWHALSISLTHVHSLTMEGT